jgi:heparin binding hemagglutinin HbhA
MTTLTDDLKKTAVDTGYVVVGITDLAVERVRATQAKAAEVRADVLKAYDAEKIQASLQESAKQLPTVVQNLPTTAVSKGLEAAGKVEESFDDLAARGKSLVERIRKQKATQDLVQQGRTTLSRTKAAVTTVRRGAKDTTTAAKATVTTATREADKAATATKTPAKRTATTARTRANASKTAVKGAATTARKTATTARKATSDAAAKVG